jgi:hypothetical protein
MLAIVNPRSRSFTRATVCAAVALGAAGAITSAAASRPIAHAARRLTGTATAHMKLQKANGKTLTEAGPVSGSLTGSVQATLRTGASFTASFTIHTRSGEISGQGQAQPSKQSSRFQSFKGTFTVTNGSGRYARIHGHGGLYGTIDNRTDEVVIQAVASQIFY